MEEDEDEILRLRRANATAVRERVKPLRPRKWARSPLTTSAHCERRIFLLRENPEDSATRALAASPTLWKRP